MSASVPGTEAVSGEGWGRGRAGSWEGHRRKRLGWLCPSLVGAEDGLWSWLDGSHHARAGQKVVGGPVDRDRRGCWEVLTGEHRARSGPCLATAPRWLT